MSQPTKQEAPVKHIKHFLDLNFTVVAVPAEYRVEYTVYHIEGIGPDDAPLWHEKDASSSPSPVEKLEDAEVFLHGSVKWDGCSDWILDELQNNYMHSCDREGLLRVGEVMARCWDWTAELCPNWDE
ncbi:hypothetical protein [Ralstonia phage RP31]|uniref:Uncharacterized protein n=2 Tax=Ripduovirus RP12 TaxID=2560700 RepID=A0A1L7N0Z9_9CAUD|nr:hypothetical protein FDH28_gp249 [Ralstonia phage RP12]BAW19146.1 hypothetical protein [Ralstonia phage RP12]BAW19432.1 hypothetical protein [Ralstonia phage RP31]